MKENRIVNIHDNRKLLKIGHALMCFDDVEKSLNHVTSLMRKINV